MNRFFENLAVVFGADPCAVALAPDVGIVAWQEEARGKLHVIGGALPRHVVRVKVSLVERWVTGSGEGRKDHYQTYQETVLAADAEMQPHEGRRFEYTLTVPRGSDFQHQWYVEASARVRVLW